MQRPSVCASPGPHRVDFDDVRPARAARARRGRRPRADRRLRGRTAAAAATLDAARGPRRHVAAPARRPTALRSRYQDTPGSAAASTRESAGLGEPPVPRALAPVRATADGRSARATIAVVLVTYTHVYEGPPGSVHGGIVAAGFDMVLGAAASMAQAPRPHRHAQRALPQGDAAVPRDPLRGLDRRVDERKTLVAGRRDRRRRGRRRRPKASSWRSPNVASTRRPSTRERPRMTRAADGPLAGYRVARDHRPRARVRSAGCSSPTSAPTCCASSVPTSPATRSLPPAGNAMHRGEARDRPRPEVAEGVDVFLRLAEHADAVSKCSGPASPSASASVPTTACAANPRLVYGRLTGYGQDGPYAAMAGHDIDYIAIARRARAPRTRGRSADAAAQRRRRLRAAAGCCSRTGSSPRCSSVSAPAWAR